MSRSRTPSMAQDRSAISSTHGCKAAAACLMRRNEKGARGLLFFCRRFSVQDLAEEQLGALVLRAVEEGFGIGLFDYLALVEEDHPVRHGVGEAHFVGHAEHGHADFG